MSTKTVPLNRLVVMGLGVLEIKVGWREEEEKREISLTADIFFQRLLAWTGRLMQCGGPLPWLVLRTEYVPVKYVQGGPADAFVSAERGVSRRCGQVPVRYSAQCVPGAVQHGGTTPAPSNACDGNLDGGPCLVWCSTRWCALASVDVVCLAGPSFSRLRSCQRHPTSPYTGRPHRQPQRINLRGMLGARDGVFEQACDTAQHNLQLDAPCFVQSLEQ